EQLRYWRRYIHAHPELSFNERKTSAFVVQELKQLEQLDIKENVGGYGVVATLTSGRGPVLAIRAGMDALPIQEENGHDLISMQDCILHACGHDAQSALVLGTAHLLHERFVDGELDGTVKRICQPAEEATDDYGLSGAPYMIKEG